jgi:hypothetical protein
VDKLIVDFAVLEGAESEMRTVVQELDDLRSMLHDKILPVTQQWTGAPLRRSGELTSCGSRQRQTSISSWPNYTSLS